MTKSKLVGILLFVLAANAVTALFLLILQPNSDVAWYVLFSRFITLSQVGIIAWATWKER